MLRTLGVGRSNTYRPRLEILEDRLTPSGLIGLGADAVLQPNLQVLGANVLVVDWGVVVQSAALAHATTSPAAPGSTTTTGNSGPASQPAVTSNHIGPSPQPLQNNADQSGMSAPTNLTGQIAGTTAAPQVALQWDYAGTPVDSFQIERAVGKRSIAMTGNIPYVLGQFQYNYSDTAVTAGATYHYWVRAVAGTMSSAPSNQVTITIPS